MTFQRLRLEFIQFSPPITIDCRSPVLLDFSQMCNVAPELFNNLPLQLKKKMMDSNPWIWKIEFIASKNNLPPMFNISYNTRLCIKGSFKKIDDKSWNKFDLERELIRADNFGSVLRLKGWGKLFNCKIRVVPMFYQYDKDGKFNGFPAIQTRDDLYIKSPQRLPAPTHDHIQTHYFNQITTNTAKITHHHKDNRLKAAQFTFGKTKLTHRKKLNFKKSLAYQMQTGVRSLRDYFDLSSLKSESEATLSRDKTMKTRDTSRQQSIRSKKLQEFMSKLGGETSVNLQNGENVNPNVNSSMVIFSTPTKSWTEMQAQKNVKKANTIGCELCGDKKKKDIDMLKCGHILCLDCILDKGMTYSECFICQNTLSATPDQAQHLPVEQEPNVFKERIQRPDAISIQSSNKQKTQSVSKLTKDTPEIITAQKFNQEIALEDISKIETPMKNGLNPNKTPSIVDIEAIQNNSNQMDHERLSNSEAADSPSKINPFTIEKKLSGKMDILDKQGHTSAKTSPLDKAIVEKFKNSLFLTPQKPQSSRKTFVKPQKWQALNFNHPKDIENRIETKENKKGIEETPPMKERLARRKRKPPIDMFHFSPKELQGTYRASTLCSKPKKQSGKGGSKSRKRSHPKKESPDRVVEIEFEYDSTKLMTLATPTITSCSNSKNINALEETPPLKERIKRRTRRPPPGFQEFNPKVMRDGTVKTEKRKKVKERKIKKSKKAQKKKKHTAEVAKLKEIKEHRRSLKKASKSSVSKIPKIKTRPGNKMGKLTAQMKEKIQKIISKKQKSFEKKHHLKAKELLLLQKEFHNSHSELVSAMKSKAANPPTYQKYLKPDFFSKLNKSSKSIASKMLQTRRPTNIQSFKPSTINEEEITSSCKKKMEHNKKIISDNQLKFDQIIKNLEDGKMTSEEQQNYPINKNSVENESGLSESREVIVEQGESDKPDIDRTKTSRVNRTNAQLFKRKKRISMFDEYLENDYVHELEMKNKQYSERLSRSRSREKVIPNYKNQPQQNQISLLDTPLQPLNEGNIAQINRNLELQKPLKHDLLPESRIIQDSTAPLFPTELSIFKKSSSPNSEFLIRLQKNEGTKKSNFGSFEVRLVANIDKNRNQAHIEASNHQSSSFNLLNEESIEQLNMGIKAPNPNKQKLNKSISKQQ